MPQYRGHNGCPVVHVRGRPDDMRDAFATSSNGQRELNGVAISPPNCLAMVRATISCTRLTTMPRTLPSSFCCAVIRPPSMRSRLLGVSSLHEQNRQQPRTNDDCPLPSPTGLQMFSCHAGDGPAAAPRMNAFLVNFEKSNSNGTSGWSSTIKFGMAALGLGGLRDESRNKSNVCCVPGAAAASNACRPADNSPIWTKINALFARDPHPQPVVSVPGAGWTLGHLPPSPDFPPQKNSTLPALNLLTRSINLSRETFPPLSGLNNIMRGRGRGGGEGTMSTLASPTPRCSPFVVLQQKYQLASSCRSVAGAISHPSSLSRKPGNETFESRQFVLGTFHGQGH